MKLLNELSPSKRYRDLSGQRFYRLQVKRFSHVDRHNQAVFECVCDCGAIKLIPGPKMTSGGKQSCGCLGKEKHKARVTIHGFAKTDAQKYHKSIYGCWRAMWERCNNIANRVYHNYGGRGIKVCPEWRSFARFYADMGDRPDGYSLDRIDNDGNYEPSNCRWTSRWQQAANKRGLKFSKQDIDDIRGLYKEFRIKELAFIYDVHPNTISQVIKHKTWRDNLLNND